MNTNRRELKIPQLCFPEFDGEWVERRLGEIPDVHDGTHESPKYNNDGYSHTNRLCKELTSQGNIVCFRNQKESTDAAITLFANKTPTDEIIIDLYETYVAEFNEGFVELIQNTPSVNRVTQLAAKDEEQALAFKTLAKEEGLDADKLEKLLSDYLFTSKKPLRNDVVEAMDQKPRFERSSFGY